MGSSPTQKLWVGMFAVMVVVVEFPVALHKCIFDEVQPQAERLTTHPGGPSYETRFRDHTRQQTNHVGRKASAHDWSVKQRRSLRMRVPPTCTFPQPIRIRRWFAKESDRLSEAEKGRIEAAVDEAVMMVSSLLSVNRVTSPLLLSRDVNKYCKFLWRNSSTVNYNRCGRANNNYRYETCLDVTIPEDHLGGCYVYPEADSPQRTLLRPAGSGLLDADFVLYLQVHTTDKCRAEPYVLAYAVHCQTDSHGRPVAGVVVICRDRLTGTTYNHQSATQTVIHEMFHVLGFSKYLFHTWRDCSSTPPVGAGCSPRGKVTYSDGSGQMRIYTPSVISALQKHQASTDPELGGPLENLDTPPGSQSSHWEARVLQGSIMAAELEDPTAVRFDLVTLAALQDTGWYSVNLSRAQRFVWGEGEGAMFGSLSSCHNKSSLFFCSGSGSGCHYLHLHKGQCQTDQYLEGCRIYKPVKNGSECWREENGRKSADDDWSGEIFGFDSRCFFSSIIRKSQIPLFNTSVVGQCYRHRCTGPNRYQIQVSGSEWVDCPAGGTTQIKGFLGLVSCPDRRLCLYSDVTPSSQSASTFPASSTRDPYETSTSAQNETGFPLKSHPGPSVTAALSITAASCLLAAVVGFYRKFCSHWHRIHSAPLDHSNL